MKIYGRSDQRQVLERKLVWATPGQRGFPKAAANGVRPIPGAPTQRAVPVPASIPSSSQRVQPVKSQSRAQSNATTAAQQEALRKQEEAFRKQREAYEKAQELKQILNNLEKVDDEGRRASLLDTLCSVDDVLGLPEHPNPPSIADGQLRVNLLKHQVC